MVKEALKELQFESAWVLFLYFNPKGGTADRCHSHDRCQSRGDHLTSHQGQSSQN